MPEIRLADALTGRYGDFADFAVKWSSAGNDRWVTLHGTILDYKGDDIGGTFRRIGRRDGYLVVQNLGLNLDTAAQGQGVGTVLRDELERLYGRSCVDFIEVRSHEDGAYSLDRPGLAWNPEHIDSTFAKLRSRIGDLVRTTGVGAADEQVLREIQDRIRVRFSDQDVPRLEGRQKWPTLGWPTPNEVAEMISRDLSDPELGRRLLRESSGTIFPLSEMGRAYGV